MTFHDLHRGEPFLLPNAWDYASAAALAAAGFAAVGTTSLGVAAAAGLPDGTGATRGETVALAKRLSPLPCHVTVDIEGGFSTAPAEVAELVAELASAGAVGVNIEDGRSDGSLVPAEQQAAVIQAVKTAVPGMFVNARTDTFWLGTGGLDETVRRCRAYADAGADGVFVPGTADPATISALVAAVAAPVNVLLTSTPFPELADLGVRRVSTGSLLFRIALDAALATALSASATTPPTPRFGYADVQAMLSPGTP
jgi:2-methylisocitrate lyase-like PEP mutase family enzyme